MLCFQILHTLSMEIGMSDIVAFEIHIHSLLWVPNDLSLLMITLYH